MTSMDLTRAIVNDDKAAIPAALLEALVSYTEFERSDVSWLLMGLKSLDEEEQRKLIASFRKQIWHVAAQVAWEAAKADVEG